MAGRTPSEAVNNFLEPLQRAISCLTDSILHVSGGYYVSATPHVAILSDNPSRLNVDPVLYLYIAHQYRPVEYEGTRGPWKVATVGHYYSLQDANEQEIIAYHWHPSDRTPVSIPHIHLGVGAQVGRPELVTAHLPSGRISLEAFLRMTITDFRVRPRRSDWNEVLMATEEAFQEWKT